MFAILFTVEEGDIPITTWTRGSISPLITEVIERIVHVSGTAMYWVAITYRIYDGGPRRL